MVQGKQKFALWLTPVGSRLVEDHYREDNCKSKSEFIERAVDFYCGFLDTDKAADYLPLTLCASLEGVLQQFGDRLGLILFKQAVELGMMGRLVAADSHMDSETIRALRDRCVVDVKKTKGQLSFRDMLRLQKDE